MEFRALGPLEVLRRGASIALGPRMQRSLLAVLLIHANEVVPVERILEGLWGPDAVGKENALWVHVSRLRSALEPDRVGRGASDVLLRRAGGYVLVVDPGAYDVARFDELAAQGGALLASDPAAAGDVLRRALGLWRGPPYDEFRYDSFAQAEISRLDEARIAVLEDRIDADLASGLAGELVSELEVIRQDHPFRERPVGQLMLALYRSGRAADALRAFDRFRREVGEELGIDPSPQVRRLEEQILLHDERLRRRPAAGEFAPVDQERVNPFKGLRPFSESDAEHFFGRDALVAEMLRRLSSGQRLVAVVGASGSGQSSVVRAGLIPAVRKVGVAGSEQWLTARMVPGSHPFAELEAALLRAARRRRGQRHAADRGGARGRRRRTRASGGDLIRAGAARPAALRRRQPTGGTAAVPVHADRVVRPPSRRPAAGVDLPRDGRGAGCAASPRRGAARPAHSRAAGRREAAVPAPGQRDRARRVHPPPRACVGHPGTGRRRGDHPGGHRGLRPPTAARVRRRPADRCSSGGGRARGAVDRLAPAATVDRGQPR